MRAQLYNLESEHAIIGGILLRPENLAKVRAELSPEDFGSDKRRALFKVFLEIADKGEPIILSIVASELERTGNLEKAGGRDYLSELAKSIFTSAGLGYHVEALKAARSKPVSYTHLTLPTTPYV